MHARAPRIHPPDRDRAATIRRALIDWYVLRRRTLPWRPQPGERPDPWQVLVSEFMLQQTPVATVRDRFGPFLQQFPDPAAMAARPVEDVLHAWQGLGYYRRARLLHACARAVVERHDGEIPASPVALAALPGIGPYTAAAVAAIAFAQPVVPVDGNVERVLARLFALERPLPGARSELRALAQGFAAPECPAELAQALMELGALVCRPRQPACSECPLSAFCAARAAQKMEHYPLRAPRRPRPRRFAVAFAAVDDRGRILLRIRPPDGLLGGLAELPGSAWLDDEPARPLEHAPFAADWRPLDGAVRHVFTHFTLDTRLWCAQSVRAPFEPVTGASWYEPGELAGLALSTLTRKLLSRAGYAAPPLPGRHASRK